jgi:predicted  nucleic acid-binding Zn-ribbon protein|tara:strand:+ start:226 stop:537 length:312 start_codon:yes stop_codon:yes gene_type:complete
MSDIHETLLNNFDEARDMGMGTNEAMTWAREKTHGYVDKKETKMETSNEIKMLQDNVAELQKQLANANKRIAELVANNKNKQEALLDVVKILNEGLNKHGEKT